MIPISWQVLSDGWTTAPEAVVLRGGSLFRRVKFHATAVLLEHPVAGWVLFDTLYSSRFFEETSRFPLFGPDCLLDLTWIGDAVDAVLLALQADARCDGRVYHITSGAPLSRQRVLETLFAACGLEVRLRPMPLSLALALGSALEGISRLATMGRWEPPLTRYSVGALAYGQTLDISAARRDLGYAPLTDILSRLQACGLAWCQRHSPL